MRGQFARLLLIERVQPTANRLSRELLGEELAIAIVKSHKAATNFSPSSNGALFQPLGERQPRPYCVIVNWHSLVDVEPYDWMDVEAHDQLLPWCAMTILRHL